ncbi:acetylserotonin O-methyltransferase-like [Bufo gargarizans]|uniref:acetylserotonin O-methyltransferase-like n=1 Tax=Bufo gargarizans TaxID=30331 RepID=UPI001CF440FD|nr:acetylserotonin O-methyltransferase-like [Bufo gargarizans]
MCSSKELDFPQILLEYCHGFFNSKTIFAACELGVFDLLHEVQESSSAATIASRLSTSEDGMERLLDACVGLKLLKVDLKNNKGYYSNTDVSTMYLVKSSPKTLYYMAMYFSKVTYMCWHFLPQAVREGKSQYERALGTTSKDLFETIYSKVVQVWRQNGEDADCSAPAENSPERTDTKSPQVNPLEDKNS